MQQLKEKMQELREELDKLMNKTEAYNKDKVLKLSQELDHIIITYIKRKMNKDK